MPDCTYCDEHFPDDEAYLAHLGDAHRDDLSRIDRRRVESFEADAGPSRTVVYGGLAAVGLLLVVGAFLATAQGGVGTLWQGDGGGADGGGGPATDAQPTGVEDEPLPERGNQTLLQDVQRFPSQGTSHVSAGTEVDYSTNPPTSGPHYDNPARPGYKAETPAAGNLVHSLEHGAVVIYYDPAALTPEAEASLRAFAENHQDPWAAVIVAPNPNGSPESAYVLTAWRTMLRTDDYDADQVRAFLAEYVGRGPEHPVR